VGELFPQQSMLSQGMPLPAVVSPQLPACLVMGCACWSPACTRDRFNSNGCSDLVCIKINACTGLELLTCWFWSAPAQLLT
jgi:hypothetical protein